MAIGAKDPLDQKLKKIYFEKQTQLCDVAKIDPEDVWKTMAVVATNNLAFMRLNKAF